MNSQAARRVGFPEEGTVCSYQQGQFEAHAPVFKSRDFVFFEGRDFLPWVDKIVAAIGLKSKDEPLKGAFERQVDMKKSMTFGEEGHAKVLHFFRNGELSAELFDEGQMYGNTPLSGSVIVVRLAPEEGKGDVLERVGVAAFTYDPAGLHPVKDNMEVFDILAAVTDDLIHRFASKKKQPHRNDLIAQQPQL